MTPLGGPAVPFTGGRMTRERKGELVLIRRRRGDVRGVPGMGFITESIEKPALTSMPSSEFLGLAGKQPRRQAGSRGSGERATTE